MGNKVSATHLRRNNPGVTRNVVSPVSHRLSAKYRRLNTTNVYPTKVRIMGKKGPKKNYYVVCRGRMTGILDSWGKCQGSTSGFSGAIFKGYETYDQAQEAWNTWLQSQGIPSNEGAPQNTLEGNLTNMSTVVNQTAVNNYLQARAGFKRKYEDGDHSLDIRGDTAIEPPSVVDEKDNAIPTDKLFIDLTGSPELAIASGNLSVPREGNDPSFKKAKLDNGDKPPLNLDIEIPNSEFEFSDDDIFDNIKSSYEDAPKSVELTEEQKAVVKMAISRNNIFLTGAAGSGKTVTLLEIIEKLKKKLQDDNPNIPKVQVAAPTGLAALPLKGRTTYSVAGWKPDSFKTRLDELLDIKKIKKRTIKALRRLEVLILEEISMVESQFLERLNLLLQTVKGNTKPFGGIQVIFLGDFYQLPPVKPFEHCMICGVEMVGTFDRVCESNFCKNRENNLPFEPGEKWAFNAPVWKSLNMRHVKLEQIHRQKDETFKALLNKVRNGVALSNTEWYDLIRPKELPPAAFPVRLMSKRIDVERFNNHQLGLIEAEAKVWDAHDGACQLIEDSEEDDFRQWDPEAHYLRQSEIDKKKEEYRIAISEWHRFPKKLTLKVGAKVVLLHNQEQKSGLVNGSQGTIVGFVNASKWPNEIKGEHAKWRQEQLDIFVQKNPWRPVVKFADGRTSAIAPVSSETLMGTVQDRYLACRTQIPLMLAWALSIHKSQGMTMEYVEVSRKDIFESGQLYVALSRATKLEGLTVTGYEREQVAMDEDVVEFYRKTKWEKLGAPVE